MTLSLKHKHIVQLCKNVLFLYVLMLSAFIPLKLFFFYFLNIFVKNEDTNTHISLDPQSVRIINISVFHPHRDPTEGLQGPCVGPSSPMTAMPSPGTPPEGPAAALLEVSPFSEMCLWFAWFISFFSIMDLLTSRLYIVNRPLYLLKPYDVGVHVFKLFTELEVCKSFCWSVIG